MSYHVYTTNALVCGSFSSNTADKSFLLFTKELGMVYASARSVREERSRQRYALQDFSVVTVSLIRGVSGWRIGSVTSAENLFHQAGSRQARGSVVKGVKLIRRYIQGEEPHQTLYENSVADLRYLAQGDVMHRVLAEEISTARMLYWLGYISDSPGFTELYTGTLEEIMGDAELSLLPELQAVTNQALRASHL
jgi:recombinational DNA repair protein (RecF pathway)